MKRREFVIRPEGDAVLAVRALRAEGWRLESFHTARADRLAPRPVLFPQEPRPRRAELVMVLEYIRDN
jgi:hypothetical protein